MDKEYLNVFLEESQEHLQSLNENILKLEQNFSDISVLNEIFRSAHTFKGMSMTMGFVSVANLTHEMENVLDLLRNDKMKVTTPVIDVLFECIDNLEKMVVDIQNGGVGNYDVEVTIKKLISLHKKGSSDISGIVETSIESDGNIEALHSNHPSHSLKIIIHKDCIMKSVRAFMVLESLHAVGDIISTIPSQELIESEDFKGEMIVSILTNVSDDEIKNAALKISEVEKVELENLHLDIEVQGKSELTEDKKSKKTKDAPSQINNQTIRVNLEKIEQLMNTFEESVIERGRIEEIAQTIGDKELTERLQRLSNISKDLQSIVLNMRMVPVETVFNRFPRMIRSLAKDLGKKIDLIITGEETEIDRLVIDEIGDPLVHLIRNSVDHGIETVEVRRKNDKSETGTVNLEAYHSGNNVVIQIKDDGNGINKRKVIEKAIKNSIITESQAAKLSDGEIYDLIFAPGFSTADKVSDLSGRGVGLDVVKTTITRLGGKVSVKSEEGKGTTFIIELPLTLSIIQSMLVESNENRYAIPLGNIIETMKIPQNQIQIIQGKEVINYREKTIQLISLKELFHKKQWYQEDSDEQLLIVIIKEDERTFAIVVDNILGQREIVLKSLGVFFKDSANHFSGASILGDGKVVLIIDCEKIKKS